MAHISRASRKPQSTQAPQKRRGSRGPKLFSMGGGIKKYRNQSFWAERGLIHCVDERDGDYQAITLQDWLGRTKALHEESKRLTWADERDDMIELVEAMVEVAATAKKQGDPCRPLEPHELEKAAKAAKERLQEAKRTSILVPGGVSGSSGQKLFIP